MPLRFYLFAFILTGSLALHAQVPIPASGRIVRLTKFPSVFVQPRTIDVWLPEGYSAKNKYAVLYMHDGQMLFDSASTWNKQEWGVDETLTALIQEKKIRPCIVVGIWNNGPLRPSEYFPEKIIASLSGKMRNEVMQFVLDTPRADQYLKFIVRELKPYIDSAFSTHHNQRNTFIAGSSMGGLISWYALCEYPSVFFGAACLSTHWPGTFNLQDTTVPIAFDSYLKQYLPDAGQHRIYFDHGTATLDSVYRPSQLRVDRTMKARGYSKNSWMSREFAGADHSERAWRNRLRIPLAFLLQ
jgi:enterochelin esterase-like enzyme